MLRRLISRFLPTKGAPSGQSFLGGSLVLTLSGFINRVIGFVYSACIIRWAGGEAMGLYRMAAPVYVTLFTLATAGIPYALSVRVAEEFATNNPAKAHRLLSKCLRITLTTSLLSIVGLWVALGPFSKIAFSDPRAGKVAWTLAPCLVIGPVATLLEGYFEGRKLMLSLGFAQVMEQLTFAGVTLGLVYFSRGADTVFAAQAIAIGMFASWIVLALILSMMYLIDRKATLTKGVIQSVSLDRVVKLAWPVAVGKLVSSASLTFNLLLIPARLQFSGLSVPQATEQFGLLMGVAIPLVFLPNIISFSLSRNLVPSISAACAKGDWAMVQYRIKSSLETSIVTGLPFVAALVSLARPICQLVYAQPEAAMIAAIVALGGPFAYLRQTSQGVLEGLGKPGISLRNYMCGLGADTLAVYFLAASPLGIRGAAMASVINFTVGAVLNLISINRICSLGLNWVGAVLAPSLAAAAAGIVGLLVFSLLKVSLLPGLIVAGITIILTYLLLLLATASGQNMYRRLLAIGPFNR